MARRLFIAHTTLILSLPITGAHAGGAPYLPKPHPHLYSNPKAYQEECQIAEAKHQVAVEKRELENGGDLL